MKRMMPVIAFLAAGLVLAVSIYQLMRQAHDNGYAEAQTELHAAYLARTDSLVAALADSGMRLARLQDSLEVPRVEYVTRWRTMRDSIVLTDTVMVAAALDTCNAAVEACEASRLVAMSRASLEAQRADTLAVALDRTRRAWEHEITQRRGFLHDLKTGLPYLAAGVVVGLVIPR